ncbi:MAG TPA: DUF5050 domain-containing protein, partial [Anaerolineae bacterium]|nr:DUF5050 domain-containing protein [Anaerolineae bacterium]
TAPTTPATSNQTITPQANMRDWSYLTYQSFRNSNWDIFTTLGDHTGETQRTTNTSADIHPRLNRATQEIVFASNRSGSYQIYKMRFDGSHLTQLTANGQDNVYPYWSPDGSKIAFESYVDGNAEIYTMNADGSNRTRLTNNDHYDSYPTWSPQGDRLAFVSNRQDGYRIWTMNPDGSNPVKISTHPYSNHPVWSPDGQWIAYDADANGDGWYDLWLMSPDGETQFNFYNSSSPYDIWVSGWSPDGDRVLYTRIEWQYIQGNWYIVDSQMYSKSLTANSNIPISQTDVDWRPDWQAADAAKPTSSIHPLPPFSRYGQPVNWLGQDTGPSDIREIQVQYRLGPTGNWTDWHTTPNNNQAIFNPLANQTVYFRSRATDNAYNREEWPATYDTSTTFYDWALHSQIYDTAGNPLPNVNTTANADILATLTPETGHFQTYLINNSGDPTLSWAQTGYGNLPATTYPAHRDQYTHLYLPPANNILTNPNLDTNLDGWSLLGPHDQAETYRHTGQAGLRLGHPYTLATPTIIQDNIQLVGSSTNLTPLDDGTMKAIWVTQNNNNTHTIYYAQADANGNWTTPQSLRQITNHYAGAFAYIHPNGFIQLLWQEYNTDSNMIYAQTQLLNGNWTAPKLIYDGDSDNGYLLLTGIHIDDNNKTHLVINDQTQYPSQLIYMSGNSNGSWNDPISMMNSGNNYNSQDKIKVGPDGRIHALLHSSNQLFYLYQQNNGQWSTPEELGSTQSFNSKATLFITPDNDIHVVWQASVSYDDFIYHRQRLGTDNWSNPFILVNADDAFNTYMESIVTTNGMHLAFNNYNSNDITYRSLDEHGQWSPLQKITSAGYVSTNQPWFQAINDQPYLFYTVYQQSDQKELLCYQLVEPVAQAAPRTCVEKQLFEPAFFGVPNAILDAHLNLHVSWWGQINPEHLQYKYTTIRRAETETTTVLSQTVTIPSTLPNPNLSFVYELQGGQDLGDSRFVVNVVDEGGVTAVYTTTQSTPWRLKNIDLSPWAGQTIDLNFTLDQAANDLNLTLHIDEINLGTAYPDLWLNLSGPLSVPPNEEALITINYGNHHTIAATDTQLTLDLPAGIEFVAATPAPTTTSPQPTWDLGTIDPLQANGQIQLTLRMTAQPQLNNWLNVTGALTHTLSEPNNSNNDATWTVAPGYRLTLPILYK